MPKHARADAADLALQQLRLVLRGQGRVGRGGEAVAEGALVVGRVVSCRWAVG